MRREFSHRKRLIRCRFAPLPSFAVAVILLASSTFLRANTAQFVNVGATDLTSGTSYTPSGAPTAASDVEFQSGTTYAPVAFTINGASLGIGTLNDLDGAQTLTISNTSSTVSTLTLNGGGDSVSPGAGDLLYVAAGGTLTINSGTATPLNIALATSGSFDVIGASTINSNISGSGFGIVKTGAGTLNLGGSNSFSGGMTISAGTVELTNDNAAGSGTITLGNSSANATFGVYYNGSSGPGIGSVANPINVLGTGTNTIANYNYYPSFSGLVTLNSNTVTIVDANSQGQLNLSGGVSGIGNIIFEDNTNAGNGISESGSIGSIGTITNTGTSTVLTTISGNIGPTVTGITENGSGALALSGSNTFTGGLTVTSGTVYGENQYALGSASVNIGTISLGAAGSSSNAAIITNGGGNETIYSPISVLGSGTNVLSAINFGATYDGAVTLNGVNLYIVTNNTGGSILTIGGAISGTGNLIIQGNTPSTTANSGATLSGTVNMVGTITNSGTAAGNTSITGNIGSNVTGITENSGTSQLTLSGSNTFTGGITIKNGTVNVSGYAVTESSTSNIGTITLGDVANTGSSATLNWNNNTSSNQSNPINVVGTGSRYISVTSWNPTLSGLITLNGGITLTVLENNSGGSTITIAGGVSGTGNLILQGDTPGMTHTNGVTLSGSAINMVGTITNSGTGTNSGGVQTTLISAPIGANVTALIESTTTSALQLTGSNTFFGDTTVTSGTLQVNNQYALQYSVLNVNSTSGTTTFAQASTLGGLAGNGNLTPNQTLTIGNSNVSNGSGSNPNTLNPTYSGNLNGTGGLTKIGSNTQTLSGSDSYTGATTVSGGTLSIAGTLSTGNSVTVGSSGTGSLIVQSGGALIGTSLTIGNNSTNYGSVEVTGSAGFTSVTVGNAGAGTLTVDTSGTLTNSGAFIVGDTSTASGTANINGVFNETNTAGTAMTIGQASGDYSVLNVSGTVNDLGGISVTYQGTGILNLNSSGVINLGSNPGLLVAPNQASANGTANLAGALSATNGDIIVSEGGAGVLNLTSGTTTIAGGHYLYTNEGDNVNGSSGIANISGGVLVTPGIDLGYSSTASGTNTSIVNLTGGQIVFTSGIGFHTGGYASSSGPAASNTQMNLGGGTIVANSAWSTSMNAALTGSNGNVTIQASSQAGVSNNVTLSGTLSGPGGITKTGGGTLTLGGTGSVNTYTGSTIIAAGTLSGVVSGALTSSSNIDVQSGATLDLSNANVGSYTESGSQTIMGGGTITGGGTQIYIGGTLQPHDTASGIATMHLTNTFGGGLTLLNGSTFSLNLSSTTSDALVSNGPVDLGVNGTDTINLAINLTAQPTNGMVYTILTAESGDLVTTGSFSSGGVTLGNDAVFSVYNGTYGENFEINYGTTSDTLTAETAVPEPGTWAAVLTGLGMLVCVQRMRRRGRN